MREQQNYQGMKKDDHDRLGEAATMYRNLTGRDLAGAVSGIPVQKDDKESLKDRQKRSEQDLQRSAEVTRRREEADQETRRLQQTPLGGELPQDKPPVKTANRKQQEYDAKH